MADNDDALALIVKAIKNQKNWTPANEKQAENRFNRESISFDALRFNSIPVITIDSETSYAKWMREWCEFGDDINMHLVDGVWVKR